jgi:hypothetical protein
MKRDFFKLLVKILELVGLLAFLAALVVLLVKGGF